MSSSIAAKTADIAGVVGLWVCEEIVSIESMAYALFRGWEKSATGDWRTVSLCFCLATGGRDLLASKYWFLIVGYCHFCKLWKKISSRIYSSFFRGIRILYNWFH